MEIEWMVEIGREDQMLVTQCNPDTQYKSQCKQNEYSQRQEKRPLLDHLGKKDLRDWPQSMEFESPEKQQRINIHKREKEGKKKKERMRETSEVDEYIM